MSLSFPFPGFLPADATPGSAPDLQARWQLLVEHLAEVAWFCSVDGKQVHYVSPSVRAVYGREPQAFIDDPMLWFTVCHPEDRARLQLSLQDLQTHGRRTVEYRVAHADGSWRWLRDRASVLRNARGEAIGLGGVAEDITREHDVDQALQDRELRLAGIVETAMDAIITVDVQHRIQVFNHAAGQMFRIAPTQAIGRPLSDYIPARLREQHAVHVRQFARTGATTRRMGAMHTLTGLRSDGSEFPIEASISRHGHGDQVLMTVVLRDVTEQHAAQAAMQRQQEAEAANRAKTEFLSRMSHEVRTPLNAVLGFAQLLHEDQGHLLPRHATQVSHILRAGWHLLDMIDDVLDVSRIEAGRLSLQCAPTDVRDSVLQALRLASSLAEQAGITLAPPPDGPALQVLADPRRLQQVLLNLLTNAIKYNRHGGSVRLRIHRRGPQVHVHVHDNGIGMTPQQRAQLFQPFNRLGQERSEIQGHGIGLSLTRALLAMMDGRIRIRSRSGTGTCVGFSLPLSVSSGSTHRGDAVASTAAQAPWTPAHPLATPKAEAAGAPDSAAAPGGRVLYVEDNPVNQLLVQQLLARWPGVAFTAAHDAMDGLRAAHALRPDLILLDMRLPDHDGLWVLQALQQDPGLCQVPVLALSASVMAQDIQAALNAGARSYLAKPLDFAHFLEEVGRWLGPKVPEPARPGQDGSSAPPGA